MLEASFVLSLMLLAEPHPIEAHRATFERTADAIARAASNAPLFEGDSGAEKTAALLVSVGWFESGLRPDAQGDCDRTTKTGVCEKGSRAHSFCLLQINETNLGGFKTTREEILSDIDKCVDVGLRMMAQSFRICRGRLLEDRLSWYAAGSPVCGTNADAMKKSRHRILKGVWLWERATALAAVKKEEEREIERD